MKMSLFAFVSRNKFMLNILQRLEKALNLMGFVLLDGFQSNFEITRNKYQMNFNASKPLRLISYSAV